MDKPEPKQIPPGQSPVRFIMSDKHPFDPLKGFEEAKQDPDGVAVFEGDYGGQIMMTIRMSHVKCSERAFDLLLSDLNNAAWDDGGHGEGLYYERIPIGGGVAGGMGGGCVVDGVWAHPHFEEDGVDMDKLGKAVGDILECRAERLPEGLLMDRRDPNKAPRPGMIWSDKYQLWMDPDTRAPERKKQDDAIAARVERERKHVSECSGCCPCCVTGHCPETDGTSCGASRKGEQS